MRADTVRADTVGNRHDLTQSPAATRGKTRVTAVVVSFNSRDVLEACLTSLAGSVSECASTTHPAWLVALAYWLAGTLHGLIAWRLARRGILIPPQTV